MDVLKIFRISFVGLKNGEHSFNFQVRKAFFEAFKEEKIVNSQIELKLNLLKQDNMMQLNFEFDGKVEVACDRCTALFWYPIDLNELLIVKYGPKTLEQSENILVLSESEHEIKLEQYIYEFISLSLPMRMSHPEDENGNSDCDQNFLKSYLKEQQPKKVEIDPCWAALKKLKT
jgi:uncharacterized protein